MNSARYYETIPLNIDIVTTAFHFNIWITRNNIKFIFGQVYYRLLSREFLVG